jgi:hypothetical protein
LPAVSRPLEARSRPGAMRPKGPFTCGFASLQFPSIPQGSLPVVAPMWPRYEPSLASHRRLGRDCLAGLLGAGSDSGRRRSCSPRFTPATAILPFYRSLEFESTGQWIEGEEVLSPRAGSRRLGTLAQSGPPLTTWTKIRVPPDHEREPARCSSRVVESLDRSSASRATRESDPSSSRVETATTTPRATRTVPIIMSQYPGPSDTPKAP